MENKKSLSAIMIFAFLAMFLSTSTVSAENVCEGNLSNPKVIQNLKAELKKTYNEGSSKKSRKYAVKYPSSFSLEKVDGDNGIFVGSIMLIGESDMQGLPIVSINPIGEGQYYPPAEGSKTMDVTIGGKHAKWTSWWVNVGSSGCFEQGEVRFNKTPKGWASTGYISYAAKSEDMEIVKNIINSIKVK